MRDGLTRDLSAHAAIGQRLRVSADCLALADLLAREENGVRDSGALDAQGLMTLFERCDALRRPERFAALLQACACVGLTDGADGADVRPAHGPPQQRLPPLLQAATILDTAAVAASAAADGKAGPAIGESVRAARIAAIQAALRPR